MWIRFLRLCARRPLGALVAAIVLVLSLGSAIALLVVSRVAPSSGPAADVEDSANPRLLISRAWLDRYPEKSRDEIDLLVFFGGGFGIYEHGSRWRATIEFFEFERQGDSVEVTFFQDKKRHKTRFKVEPCYDDKHFDLCLDFDSSPRGPKRYRSWGSDDEDEARVPWMAAWKRGAAERARGALEEYTRERSQ